MKELSIKEKAKAYDESLGRASNLYKDAVEMENNMTTKTCEIIFPELKESEDEKMRKGIIRNLEYLANKSEGFVKDELKERIAWLEKQGKTFTKKDVDNAYLKGVCDTKHELEKSMPDAGYIFDFDKKELRKLKFRVGDIVKSKSQPTLDARKIISIGKDCYWCEDRGCIGFAWEEDCELVEQKPAWSEEDEEFFSEIISDIKFAQDKHPDSQMNQIIFDEEVTWLKSLKDRIGG